MTPTPLILPKEAEILLTALRGTEGKVDQLLPLLALLQDTEGERSDLGEALLNALRLIEQELSAFHILRKDLEARMGALTTALEELKTENHATTKKIAEMHALLLAPIEG